MCAVPPIIKRQRKAGVADVVRAAMNRVQGKVRFFWHQWSAFTAIMTCRTGLLGGRRCRCTDCGKEHFIPNSCRNRHCPMCQGGAARKWLELQERSLLPVPYFHVVFTLPHELNPLIRVNQKQLYSLLFGAASETLQDFGRNNLKAQLGITAVLHTWGQTMCEHYHLHCIVTGGGLALDGNKWISTKRSKKTNKPYLFPVQALSQVFRAKFIAGLKKRRKERKLRYHGQSKPLSEARHFSKLINKVKNKGWIVYSKEPFAGPKQVLAYLSRYTHRVAISDSRILKLDTEKDEVIIRYKDYHQNGKQRAMKLNLETFLRRLSLHILPKRFTKIRHYGILSTRNRKSKIAHCRRLLGQKGEAPRAEETSSETTIEQSLKQLPPCPHCGHNSLEIIEVLTGPEYCRTARAPPQAA